MQAEDTPWSDLRSHRERQQVLQQQRRSLAPLGWAAALLVGAAGLFWATVMTRTGQQIEANIFAAAGRLFYSLPVQARDWLRAATKALVVVAAIGACWAATRSVRATGARTASLRIGAAALFTAASYFWCVLARDVLLTRPDLGVTDSITNTFPSGHVTVVTALSATALILSPDRSRLRMLFYSALIFVEAALIVLIEAHRPSDTIAAILTTIAFALVLVRALPETPKHPWNPEIWSGTR